VGDLRQGFRVLLQLFEAGGVVGAPLLKCGLALGGVIGSVLILEGDAVAAS